MKIAIEYIKWLQEEIKKINNVPVKDIEFFEKGMLLSFSKKVIEDFEFTGLNNMDFILRDMYK